MNLRVLYFASLRETLGCSSEQCELPATVGTTGELRAYLAQRDEPWPALATVKNLRVAVNQTMVGMDASLKAGDEVAFFPPVTGG